MLLNACLNNSFLFLKKSIAVKATIPNGKKDDGGGIGESNRFQTINDHMSQLQEWNPNSCRIVTGDLLETTME